MAKPDDQNNRHEFTRLGTFDQAMRKLVDVPPEKVRDREAETRTTRPKKRRPA